MPAGEKTRALEAKNGDAVINVAAKGGMDDMETQYDASRAWFFIHFYALLIKRWHNYKRDKRCVLPVSVFVAGHLQRAAVPSADPAADSNRRLRRAAIHSEPSSRRNFSSRFLINQLSLALSCTSAM